MKSLALKTLFAAGLLLFPTMSAQAGLNSDIKLDVNCYFQAKTSFSGNVDAGKVGIVRLGAKQLLNLIGREKGIRFPSGSRLMADEVGNVFIADSLGNSIMDASPYAKLEYYKNNELLDGAINVSTGKEQSRTYYRLALKLNLTSLVGTLRGVAVEALLVSAPDRNGIQITRGTITSTVNGKGSVNGGAGYYDGKIVLEGRGATVR